MKQMMELFSIAAAGMVLSAGAQTWFVGGRQLLAAKDYYACPTWHDVDGDGASELLLGVKRPYYLADGTRDYYEGRVLVLENEGTPDVPEFKLENARDLTVNGEPLVVRQDGTNYWASNWKGCWGLQAAFGDIDGDGKEDLVTGGLLGEITVYRGKGVCGEYEDQEFFSQTNAPLRAVNRSHVALRDLDGDGRDELVVGYMQSLDGGSGAFAVYRYQDGALAGGDVLTDTAGVALNIPPQKFQSNSRVGPSFADIDGDGLEDLVTGGTDGGVFYFPAEATNALGRACSWKATCKRLLPDATKQVNADHVDEPPRSRVAVADITGDGVPDLLVGFADGILRFYRGTKSKGFHLPQPSYTNLVAGVKVPTTYGEIVGVSGAKTVTAKGLPSGLSLKSKSGKYYVAGTPNKAQTATATFTVKNAKGKTLATTKVRFAVRAPNVSFAMDPMYILQPGIQTNIAITVESECAYTLKASGLPAGMKLVMNKNGTYKLSGNPTTPGEKTVTLKALYVTNAKTGLAFKTRLLIDNWRDEHIPVEDHYDNLIAGVPVSGFEIPGAVGCIASMPKTLGLVFNTKTGVVTGTPKAPGKYLVTFTRKVRTSAATAKPVYVTYKASSLFVVYQGYGDHLSDHGQIVPAMTVDLPDVDMAATNECLAGVKITLPIEVAGGMTNVAAELKASGLPKGLSCKNGKISGVPAKAGVYTVKVSASNEYGWTSAPCQFILKVKALPSWSYGTFNGAVTNDVFQGTFTLIVKNTGALSGKILTGGKTYSFSDTGYVDGDGTAYLFEKTLTIAGLTLPVSFVVEPGEYADEEFASDGVARQSGRVVADEDSWLVFDGVQNIWKRADVKKYALPVFASGVKKSLPVTRGSLTLSFGASGAVKIAGKIDGKKVSASSTLLADSFGEAQCGCFYVGYNCRLFVYIPAVDYFTCVEVTVGPGGGKKTKYDVNIDCRDYCYK